MNLRPSTTRTLAAVLLALAAGCATVNTVSPAYPESRPTMVPDKRVITDSSLNDIAYVVEVDSAMAGDLRKTQVLLRNMSSGVKNVNYMFQWYDRQGIAITSPAPVWQTIAIEGGQTRPVISIAPTPNAVNWNLSLLESVRHTPGQLP